MCPLIPADSAATAAAAACPWQDVAHPAVAAALPVTTCFAGSGHCGCMARWRQPQPQVAAREPGATSVGGDDAAGTALCSDPAVARDRTHVTVNIVGGWLADERIPYRGLHLCPTTLCTVTPRDRPSPHADGTLTAVVADASADALPSVDDGRAGLLGVIYLENPLAAPGTLTPEFHALFDVGLTLWPLRPQDIMIHYSEHDFAHYARPPPVPFARKRDGLLWMQSNCVQWRREQVEALMAHIQVDSVGACLQNSDVTAVAPACAAGDWPHDVYRGTNECAAAHYKYYIAIENSRYDNYTTEKLWRGLAAGAVPVYLGAPNVREYLPAPGAAVLMEDFPSVEALVAYLREGMADEGLYYERHMEWRARPDTWSPGFKRVIEYGRNRWACAFCEYVGAAKRAGGPAPDGEEDADSEE
jgi:hypothetical protein